MKKLLNDVAEFHDAFGEKNYGKLQDLSTDQLAFRQTLLAEEVLEFSQAVADRDITEVADAITDIIYIAVGTALKLGIPLDKCWDEVHRTNMAKFPEGKALFREDGKLIKPEGWQPPDLETILKEATDAEWFLASGGGADDCESIEGVEPLACE